MSFKILITKTAETDIKRALEYIRNILKNPKAADDLSLKIAKKFRLIQDAPRIGTMAYDSILKDWGIRYVIINNYLAFYVIKEEKIVIVRFLYAKRDWNNILQNDIM